MACSPRCREKSARTCRINAVTARSKPGFPYHDDTDRERSSAISPSLKDAGLPPVVIIAGPTASGKSALALGLAEAFGGTIINADALQVYRDLPILTAWPDAEARARVPHRLYGCLDASERGSAGRWREAALREIAASHRAGRLPIVVGGTGLYLRALRDGLAAIPPIPPEIRAEAAALYGQLGGEGFRALLATLDPEAASLLPAGRPAAADARLRGGPRDRHRRSAPGGGVGPSRRRTASRSILLMPPRAGALRRLRCPLRADDRGRRARRGGGVGGARSRARSAGDESGRRCRNCCATCAARSRSTRRSRWRSARRGATRSGR